MDRWDRKVTRSRETSDSGSVGFCECGVGGMRI